MEGDGEAETQVHKFSKLDENFEERGKDIFDTILSFGPVHELKSRLKTFEERGIDLHNIQMSNFHHFCPYQTLDFVNFVS